MVGQVDLLNFIVRANDAPMIAAYGFFIFWLDATHPGEDAVLFDRTGRPSFTDGTVALGNATPRMDRLTRRIGPPSLPRLGSRVPTSNPRSPSM